MNLLDDQLDDHTVRTLSGQVALRVRAILAPSSPTGFCRLVGDGAMLRGLAGTFSAIVKWQRLPWCASRFARIRLNRGVRPESIREP
ncbi:hypothetical protein CKO20_08620 [Rhodocyclus tenuis]|nr:hypothetical protein [Rhodocyclus tenuis]